MYFLETILTTNLYSMDIRNLWNIYIYLYLTEMFYTPLKSINHSTDIFLNKYSWIKNFWFLRNLYHINSILNENAVIVLIEIWLHIINNIIETPNVKWSMKWVNKLKSKLSDPKIISVKMHAVYTHMKIGSLFLRFYN